jgi:hypothetical protein
MKKVPIKIRSHLWPLGHKSSLQWIKNCSIKELQIIFRLYGVTSHPKTRLKLMKPILGYPCTAPIRRDAQFPEPFIYRLIHHRFIHSYLSETPVKELYHKTFGKIVTIHRDPHRLKAYTQQGAAWFPKGIVYDGAITTPVPCSLQHDTFHLGMLASVS